MLPINNICKKDFYPDEVNGLFGWINCDKIPNNNGPSALIPSNRPGLPDAVQNTGSRQALIDTTLLNRKVLDFRSEAYYFSNFSLVGKPALTTFSVTVSASAAGLDYLWDQSPSRNGCGCRVTTNRELTFFYYPSGNQNATVLTTASGLIPLNSPAIVVTRCGPSGGIVRINGVERRTSSTVFNGVSPATDNRSFQIAGNSDNSGGAPRETLDGYVAEYCFYERELLLAEIEKIEGYLAHKYNITNVLPSSHPYKTRRP